jgi:hypothetical protein
MVNKSNSESRLQSLLHLTILQMLLSCLHNIEHAVPLTLTNSECLAVLSGLAKFMLYLKHAGCELETDNEAPVWCLTRANWADKSLNRQDCLPSSSRHVTPAVSRMSLLAPCRVCDPDSHFPVSPVHLEIHMLRRGRCNNYD